MVCLHAIIHSARLCARACFKTEIKLYLDLLKHFSRWSALLVQDELSSYYSEGSTQGTTPERVPSPDPVVPDSALRRHSAPVSGSKTKRVGMRGSLEYQTPPLLRHQGVFGGILLAFERLKNGSLPGLDYPASG